MGISIGAVTLAAPVLLAPMSGVSDLPFRRLVKRLGAGLVVSEMIASEAAVRANRQTLRMCTTEAEEQPVAVQLAGCEPRVMAEAARLAADRGAAVIDINFGCPVKKVVNGQAGSALMRDEGLAARILEAVVQAVRLPVTLKMRLGWDHAHRNAAHLARIAEQSGIRMVTVHGRTRCQFYDGEADWAAIGEVKQAVQIPVIANGDVRTVDNACDILAVSGADGVMIGRGAYGRPWFLAQVMHFLSTGERLADPSLDRQRDIALDHYDQMLAHYGTAPGLRIARKHLGWYSRGLPGSTDFRARVNQVGEPEQVKTMVRALYSEAIAAAGRMARAA